MDKQIKCIYLNLGHNKWAINKSDNLLYIRGTLTGCWFSMPLTTKVNPILVKYLTQVLPDKILR
jgi:hypothetical protein